MAEDAAAHIQLKVKDQQGSEVQFKIKKGTPLRKLMDAYCSRLGLTASQVRFMVDGERISADDTAEKLGLEDEDLIDVAMEQTGGGDDAAAHIQLKVKDQQGSEVQFKIKKSTPLRKLMDAYCSRLGLTASQVRFMVDGERISADDTAEKLGLEDEDLIDVAMEQTGGGDEAGAHIQLKVKDQQGSEVQFKIKKSTPLRKLMDAYCSRLGLTASQVRFMVDGERISADDTAEKLGLEDEDLIDVAMEQTGGEGDVQMY